MSRRTMPVLRLRKVESKGLPQGLRIVVGSTRIRGWLSNRVLAGTTLFAQDPTCHGSLGSRGPRPPCRRRRFL